MRLDLRAIPVLLEFLEDSEGQCSTAPCSCWQTTSTTHGCQPRSLAAGPTRAGRTRMQADDDYWLASREPDAAG